MRLSLVIAFRYVFSKKKTNAINIISGITMAAFAIGTAAMIIVLSALNGFESTLSNLFTAFDPALKIESVKGKTFNLDSKKRNAIQSINGVGMVAGVIEDIAVVRYGESQEIACIKGVSENYNLVTSIDSTMVEGSFNLGNSQVTGAAVGYELAEKLGINLDNPISFITIYAPSRGEYSASNPESNVVTDRVLPSGKFFVQEDIDSRYILVSLPFARNIFGYKTEFSALELSVPLKENIPLVKTRIEKLLGKSFKVKDQYEQKESIYKIFESEKLAIFAILSFIMLIAAFNMAGALTMLIIEKEKDIIILRNIGLTDHKIKQVFLSVGMIIALIGCVSGLIIGGVTCWLQMQFGFIKLENSVVDYYPVTIRAFDFIIVSVIATIIGALTSWIPVRKLNAGIKFDV